MRLLNHKSSKNKEITKRKGLFQRNIVLIELVFIYALFLLFGMKQIYSYEYWLLISIFPLVTALTIIFFGFRNVIFSLNKIPLLETTSENEAIFEKKNTHASEVVFYRVYEIVGGLSIFEASSGFIHGVGLDFDSNPLQVLIFIIFLFVSIQFILGTSQQFELIKIGLRFNHNLSIINYFLIISQAVALLGMSFSISLNNVFDFVSWYVFLLAIDLAWIYLYEILRTKQLRRPIFEINIQVSWHDFTHETVKEFWIWTDLAFILYSSILLSADTLKFQLPNFYLSTYVIDLLLITIAVAVINFTCLSYLDLYGEI